MNDYQPTNNGVFGAQQPPLLPELEQAVANPYITPQKPQTFTQSLNPLHARPTPEYQPDDGAVGKQKKADDFWADLEKKNQWEMVREGMRRYPNNIEKAYQWAYNKIDRIKNPQDYPETPFYKPIPYKGTI